MILYDQLLGIVKRSQYNLDRNLDYILEDVRRYTPSEALMMRAFSIAVSSISVLSGMIAIYFFLAIDHKKILYRHRLIMLLVSFDLFKSIFLLMFPAAVVSNPSAYFNVQFCNMAGFFTSFSMEGADFTIMILAIHTVLIVTWPNFKSKHGYNDEGGLYRYRYLVYTILFCVPLILASLAFVNNAGYIQLTNLCYLPARPIWYRLVLSWIPRYIIIISIFIMYGYIYHRVKKQYKEIQIATNDLYGIKTSKKAILSRIYKALGFILFTKVTLSDNFHNEEELTTEETTSTRLSVPQSCTKKEVNVLKKAIGSRLNDESNHQLKKRREQVEWQMKAIFIYPVAYVLIWIWPMIAHGIDYRHGLTKPPIVWLNVLGATLQSSNCAVDAAIFLWREKPWKITTQKLGNTMTEDIVYLKWRKRVAWLPLFSLPDTTESGARNLNDCSTLKTNFTVCSIERDNLYEYPYSLSGLQASKDFGHNSDTDFVKSAKRKLSCYKYKLFSRGSGTNDRESMEIDVSNEDKLRRLKEKHSLIQPEVQDFHASRKRSSTESGIDNSNINHDSLINPRRSSDNYESKHTRKSACDKSTDMGFFEFLQQ